MLQITIAFFILVSYHIVGNCIRFDRLTSAINYRFVSLKILKIVENKYDKNITIGSCNYNTIVKF